MSNLTKGGQAGAIQRIKNELTIWDVGPHDASYGFAEDIRALLADIEALEAVVEAGREFLEASMNHVDRLILIQKGDAFQAALQRLQEGQGC